MKRGKPLRRRKPLTAKKRLEPGKPLKHTPLGPGKAKAIRRTPMRGPKGALERAASEAFHRAAMAHAEKVVVPGQNARLLRCPVCRIPRSWSQMEAHHVTEAQRIRKYVDSVVHADGLSDAEADTLRISLLWDKRNAFPCCDFCHERHTKAVARIPRALLNRKHEQFARELGLEHLLDRYYQGEG